MPNNAELTRMAILTALYESPTQSATPEDLERRVAELLQLGEAGLRRYALALRRQRVG